MLSISRISKLNGVATQLHNKPSDCGYGGKVITKIELTDYEKVQKEAYWNDQITEVLREIPDHQGYLLLRKAFIDMGIRKES